ncbi:hypothetical protein EYF80_036937 [Liparis tanakae]|uniref:Uncharacterized protein n=1 Tax=Liparis tanakae TaxID=230148 RepID=A0A4Z2GH17_9TELE|nr:hypothetical protein EYF80_036937 [Liparis tanakae]
MGSAVTALNRYTKTIVEFKYKRRNIAKSLMMERQLMEQQLMEQDRMWDTYRTAEANGHKPATGTTAGGPGAQGEAYC